ncbi:MAG: hexitol phosphatase HxpB [Chitinophagaceae bacterium]
MILNTAIFDMDGLLIDSEPIWQEAANEVMQKLGVILDEDLYATTIGLRTREFLQFWFNRYQINQDIVPSMEEEITNLVIDKIFTSGTLLPGVFETLEFFKKKNFQIGLATSSPLQLVDTVLKKTGLTGRFQAISSAEHLPNGKPHPQVYLDCAALLKSDPTSCLCFEDSFNGMIAAKAARMKCVVVPDPRAFENNRWEAADLKISTLRDFDERAFSKLNR